MILPVLLGSWLKRRGDANLSPILNPTALRIASFVAQIAPVDDHYQFEFDLVVGFASLAWLRYDGLDDALRFQECHVGNDAAGYLCLCGEDVRL